MKNKPLLIMFNLMLALGAAQVASAQTAFTYQGKLVDDCCPATGLYDLRLRLWASQNGGPSVSGAPTLTLSAVPVTNGLFTVSLDFGGTAFDGSRRWLEIEVRTNNTGTYVTLNPRTELTPTPYAIRALSAATVPDGSVTAAKIAASQVVKSLNGLKDNVTLTAGANVTLTPSGNNISISASGVAFSLPYSGTVSANNLGVMELFNTHANGAGLYAVGNAYAVQGRHPGTGNYGLLGHAGYGADGVAQATDSVGTRGIHVPTGNYGQLGTASFGVHGQTAGTPYGRGVFGQANGDANSYGGLFQYGTDGNNAAYLGGNGVAAAFYGPVSVNGVATVRVLTITGGADIVEKFPMSEQCIPKGAVVALDPENPGQLKMSQGAYDKRVAGIVSGANGVNHGLALSQAGVLDQGEPVALTGRVYVLADAANGAIEPGDMLTSADLPGHAMKATNPTRSFGAVLGKAITPLKTGTGFVQVLVSLQ